MFALPAPSWSVLRMRSSKYLENPAIFPPRAWALDSRRERVPEVPIPGDLRDQPYRCSGGERSRAVRRRSRKRAVSSGGDLALDGPAKDRGRERAARGE